MKKRTLLLALGATPAFIAQTAHGYELEWVSDSNAVEWCSNTANIRYSAVSFPAGSAWTNALDDVIDIWNDNPSNFNFTTQMNDNNVWTGNSQNETWFAAGDASTPPAECVSWWWPWGCFGETDVIFYNDVSYTTSSNRSSLTPYGGSNRPFQTTAMHEFGHALGLRHENDEYNIMGQDWDHINVNDETAQAYYGEDGGDGAVGLYGTNGGAGQDVSVAAWEWSGRSGEYSTHRATRMFDTGGSHISRSGTVDGQRRYIVSDGQTVQVEFSYENNGRSTQTPEVGFYVSTNNNITTWDDLIATRTPTIGRNSVYTRTYTVTLPSGLDTYDDYWLGAMIDHDNSIGEFNGSNNTASLVFQVR